MGDPAGIGPELALKAWLEREAIGSPFFVIADRDLLGPVRGVHELVGVQRRRGAALDRGIDQISAHVRVSVEDVDPRERIKLAHVKNGR